MSVPTVFLLQDGDGLSASSYHRTWLPLRHTRADLAGRVKLEVFRELPLERRFDAVVVGRMQRDDVVRNLAARKAEGTRIVWDIDDLLWRVPESNPAHKNLTGDPEAVNRMMALASVADEVWCSTAYLGAELGPMAFKAVTVPNLADNEGWPAKPPPPDDGDVRVWWGGSPTHEEDIGTAVDLLIDVARDHRVHYYFAGYCHPKLFESLYPHQLTVYPWTTLSSYHDLLRKIKPHIALAPLAHNKFNACKSPIRFFEGVMAGAVVAGTHFPKEYPGEQGLWGVVELNERNLVGLIGNHGVREHYHAEQLRSLRRLGGEWQDVKARKPWVDGFLRVAGVKANCASGLQSGGEKIVNGEAVSA